jgi:serine/threonine-protein kinase HipA
MNRCPITYLECGNQKYSEEGLRMLSRNLDAQLDFPYSAAEQINLAGKYATKLSIAGVQPKLSVCLNIPNHCLEVVERGGTYIVKPPNPIYTELPQNEDLTMRLAKLAGIDVPFHCLIYGSDGTFSYLIKRFDRHGHGKKFAVEDFSQLLEHTRDTKYDSSMEKLIPILDKYCSFPILEKVKLFRIVLFCFLVGNEDMHLKNFSLIRRIKKVELSPAYDLINSTIVIGGTEEFALPMAGKRSKINRNILCDYYGMKRLELPAKVIEDELENLFKASQRFDELIKHSFLSTEIQRKYQSLIAQRSQRLF